MNSTRYTFGTSNPAAKRLEEMSNFFNPLAADWIKRYVKTPVNPVRDNERFAGKDDGLGTSPDSMDSNRRLKPEVFSNGVNIALDLGCGPGFSTEMLRRALNFSSTFGMERSDEFLKMARTSHANCVFIKHDVTSPPFPVRADVIYCRFLLSHLCDAEKLIDMWVSELSPGGMLFIDETEGVVTDVPAFRRYLDINESLVRSQGAELFVGEKLSKSGYAAETISNELARIPVASWRAATWFYPNTVTVWETSKHVRDNFPESQRKNISESIRLIMESRESSVKTLWKMRRMVFKKRDC